jgi:hypothetical protein
VHERETSTPTNGRSFSGWNSLGRIGHKPIVGDETDQELWWRAAGGDPEAFGLLYERHARAIYNTLSGAAETGASPRI